MTSNRKTTAHGNPLVAADNDSAGPKQKRARKVTDTTDDGESISNHTASSKTATKVKAKSKQTDDPAASSARIPSKRGLPLLSAVDPDSDFDLAFYQESSAPRTIKKATAPARRSKAKEESSLRTIFKGDPPFVGHAITKAQWLIPRSYGESSANIQAEPSKPETEPKAKPVAETTLWVDKHVPYTEDEIAVNKKKVAEVRNWLSVALSPSDHPTAYKPDHRLLVLTGPAGSGKTAVLRMLSVEMHFDIIEWSNPYNENLLAGGAGTRDDEGGRNREDYVPVLRKFQEFLSRAHKYPSLVMTNSLDTTSTANYSLPASLPINDSLSNSRKLILIEDVPNISSLPVKKLFHSILRSFLSSSRYRYPIALILSDASVRYAADTDLSSFAQRREHDSFMDARTVVPPDVLNARGCCRVQFNPIAITFMIKALGRISAAELAERRPEARYLEEVAEASNGDIRSAMNTLQFLSLGGGVGGGEGDARRTGGRGGGAKKGIAEAGGRKRRKVLKDTGKNADGLRDNQSTGKVGGRESSLALFHALGKILYNKRIGDPGEDEQDYRQEDVDLPWALPDHMAESRRPLMKSSPEASIPCVFSSARRYIIYRYRSIATHVIDSIPVDPDMFTLYLHQNYLNFTTEVEEFVTASDWFSTADSLVGSGGWENSNISSQYAALLSTRGLMFSHTCPVPRLQQKVYKPEYWEMSRTLRETQGGIRDLMQRLDLAGEGSTEGRGNLNDLALKTEILPFLAIINKQQVRSGCKMHSMLQPLNSNHLNFLHSLSSYTSNRFRRPVTESLGEKDDGFGRADEGEDGPEGDQVVGKPEGGWNASVKIAVEQPQEMLFLPEDDIEDF